MQRCYGCMKEYGKEYDVCPYCGYIVGTSPESKTHLIPGTTLSGRYTVGKAIGHGGFGITYIALDNKIRKIVAIKEYFPNAFSTRNEGVPQLSCFSSESERFLKDGVRKMLDEARRVSLFSKNDNIVDIYDYFEENNTAYIVMEYLNGKNLKQYLEENGGKLAPERAVELILPVLNALEDMHKEHMIHRDISPDNIYLCDNGKVKLLDFGSARLAVEDSEKSLSVMIKRGYAPMEQYASRSKQGPWTDIYAVCATLYKMITGETPVESTEREDEELKKFSELGINGYDKVEQVLFKGLESDYRNRIQSVADLRNLLNGCFLSEYNEPFASGKVAKVNVPQKKEKKPFNPKIVVFAVAAAVVIAAVAGTITAVVIGGTNNNKPLNDNTDTEVLQTVSEANGALSGNDSVDMSAVLKSYYNLISDMQANPRRYFADRYMGGSMEENEFAVRDITGDGIPEFLYDFICGSTADAEMFIWSYDVDKSEPYLIDSVMPYTEFYSNGYLRCLDSHNQGPGDEIWPYDLLKYNTRDDTFLTVYQAVYSLEKEMMGGYFEDVFGEFPENDDKDNDGIIFYAEETDDKKIAMTAKEYAEFEKKFLPDDKYINLGWKKVTEENYRFLKSDNNRELYEDMLRLLSVETYGNAVNDGLVSEENGWVYYQNHEDNWYLYKTDGNIDIRLNTYNTWCIDAEGDYVYYANVDDSSNIYRIRKDGTDDKRIVMSSCSMLIVDGEYIYFINASQDKKLYRAKTNGTDNIKLTDSAVSSFTLCDGVIYYCDKDGGIFSIGINGSGEKKLNPDKGSYLNIYNGWIYYCNDSDNQEIYRMKPDGSSREVFCSDSAKYLNVNNGNVYYRNADDNNYLYKINIATGEKEAINSADSRYVNVTSDVVYYRIGSDTSTLKAYWY